MIKHNKKRNVGIIYEQLLLTLSKALVENNTNRVSIIKKIINDHFNPRSSLYREFRLFNALVKTTVPSSSLALKILEEAKDAAKSMDHHSLNREKSLLIKEINYKLSDCFYSKKITEYKTYATIQTLLNHWRTSSSNIEKILEYERKIHDHLLNEKSLDQPSQKVDKNINNLSCKIMLEKFNKKYGENFSPAQLTILRNFILGDERSLAEQLKYIKSSTLKDLKEYKNSCNNKILLEKIDRIGKNCNQLQTYNLTEKNIARFLLLCKLQEELRESHE